MPDRSPMDMLCTLQGEEAMLADRKRSAARKLREEADGLERQASWHDERRVWFGTAIDALAAPEEPSDDEIYNGHGMEGGIPYGTPSSEADA